MEIAIIGVGGIGGFIGAKLASTYSNTTNHSITFVQRGEHGKKIKERGILLKSKHDILAFPSFIYENTHECGIFDLIFICTKSKDLESTAQAISKNIHNNTTIISLLNGVNNAIRLQNIFPNHRILDGCIYVSAAITEPGVILQKGGAGQVFIGALDNSITTSDIAIESLLQNADIKAQISSDISTEVWRKYLFISPFATITSKYNLTIGKIVRNTDLLAQTHVLIQEILEVSKHFGAKLTQHDIDNVIDLALKIPESTPTSMQLDVYSGKLPEIDIFAEFIVSQALELGISVPLHNQMLPEIQSIIKTQMNG